MVRQGKVRGWIGRCRSKTPYIARKRLEVSRRRSSTPAWLVTDGWDDGEEGRRVRLERKNKYKNQEDGVRAS